MRRILWVLGVLLALTPTLFCNSTDYASAGKRPDVIVMGAPKAGLTWSVTDDLIAINQHTGSELGTVRITSGRLSSCTLAAVGKALCFTGGSELIKSEAGKMLLSEAFISGDIVKNHGQVFLNGVLRNGGTAEIAMLKPGRFSSNTIVSTGVVPEPESLIFMATGLFGLAIRLWHKR